MTKRLTKAVGVLLFLLFIGGTSLLPAFHRTYCADKDATHEAGACPVCQFANTPSIATSSDVAPIAESAISDDVVPQISTGPSAFFHDATQARAPPV